MLKIGNIEIKSNVILAPMSGVTDPPYRRLIKKNFGAGLVVSEMIASKAMVLKEQENLKKAGMELDIKEIYPQAVQLAGCEPEVMAEAAKLNEDKGANIIDINYGCPVKKVTNGQHAGSAMMRDEKLAIEVLEAVVKAVKIPVTLKMRMGWDSSSLNAPKLAKMAEETGIQMITVHGRTRCQFYKGTANWDFISQVKDELRNIPLIVNGDITDFDKIDAALEKSNADGIMIGRGCYGKPWFISQADEYLKTGVRTPEPSLEIQKETVLEHYHATLEHYGDIVGNRMVKKHLGWYSVGKYGSADFRNSIMKCDNSHEIIARINDFYDQIMEHEAENTVKEGS